MQKLSLREGWKLLGIRNKMVTLGEEKMVVMYRQIHVSISKPLAPPSQIIPEGQDPRPASY